MSSTGQAAGAAGLFGIHNIYLIHGLALKASLSALSTRTVHCNAEGAWVLGHSGILQRETQGCSTKVREPAGQPAGAAADGVFVDGVLDQGWASAL